VNLKLKQLKYAIKN